MHFCWGRGQANTTIGNVGDVSQRVSTIENVDGDGSIDLRVDRSKKVHVADIVVLRLRNKVYSF